MKIEEKLPENIDRIEIYYNCKLKPSERQKITNSKDCANLFFSIFDINKIEHKEMFYCMYLNRANKVLGVLMISEGGTSQSTCDPKNVFQGALLLNASALVLSHNHPSGNTQPSAEDCKLTKKIKEGATLLDMFLLDHIIINSEREFYSFSDKNSL